MAALPLLACVLAGLLLPYAAAQTYYLRIPSADPNAWNTAPVSTRTLEATSAVKGPISAMKMCIDANFDLTPAFRFLMTATTDLRPNEVNLICALDRLQDPLCSGGQRIQLATMTEFVASIDCGMAGTSTNPTAPNARTLWFVWGWGSKMSIARVVPDMYTVEVQMPSSALVTSVAFGRDARGSAWIAGSQDNNLAGPSVQADISVYCGGNPATCDWTVPLYTMRASKRITFMSFSGSPVVATTSLILATGRSDGTIGLYCGTGSVLTTDFCGNRGFVLQDPKLLSRPAEILLSSTAGYVRSLDWAADTKGTWWLLASHAANGFSGQRYASVYCGAPNVTACPTTPLGLLTWPGATYISSAQWVSMFGGPRAPDRLIAIAATDGGMKVLSNSTNPITTAGSSYWASDSTVVPTGGRASQAVFIPDYDAFKGSYNGYDYAGMGLLLVQVGSKSMIQTYADWRRSPVDANVITPSSPCSDAAPCWTPQMGSTCARYTCGTVFSIAQSAIRQCSRSQCTCNIASPSDCAYAWDGLTYTPYCVRFNDLTTQGICSATPPAPSATPSPAATRSPTPVPFPSLTPQPSPIDYCNTNTAALACYSCTAYVGQPGRSCSWCVATSDSGARSQTGFCTNLGTCNDYISSFTPVIDSYSLSTCSAAGIAANGSPTTDDPSTAGGGGNVPTGGGSGGGGFIPGGGGSSGSGTVESDGRYPGTTSAIGGALIALTFLLVTLGVGTFFAWVAVKHNLISAASGSKGTAGVARRGSAAAQVAMPNPLVVSQAEHDAIVDASGGAIRTSTVFMASPMAVGALPPSAPPQPNVPSYLRPAGAPPTTNVVNNPIGGPGYRGAPSLRTVTATPAAVVAPPGVAAAGKAAGVVAATVLTPRNFAPLFYAQLSTHVNVRKVAMLTFQALSGFQSIWLICAAAAPWISFSGTVPGPFGGDYSVTYGLIRGSTCMAKSPCVSASVSDGPLGIAFALLFIAFLLSLVMLLFASVAAVNIALRHSRGQLPLWPRVNVPKVSFYLAVVATILTIAGMSTAGDRLSKVSASLPTAFGKAAAIGIGAMAVIQLILMSAGLWMLMRKPMATAASLHPEVPMGMLPPSNAGTATAPGALPDTPASTNESVLRNPLSVSSPPPPPLPPRVAV